MKKDLIHKLVKVLEQMEDELVFTVFYSYAEFLKSHHFTPAWDFEGYYYEIQYDHFDEHEVLRFHQRGYFNEEGITLTEKEISELTKEIVEFWAENGNKIKQKKNESRNYYK